MSETLVVTEVVNAVVVTPIENTVEIASVGVQGAKGDKGDTGDTGATGASGVIAVTAPITNSGTSTSANIGVNQNALVKPVLKQTTGTFRRTPYASTATFAMTANMTYYTPFFVPEETTFDRIACRTGGYSTTVTARLGIYNSTNGLPSTLVLDAGTVSAAAATTDYLITISQTLSAGFYWLAFNAQTSSTTQFLGAAAAGQNVLNNYLLSQSTLNGTGIAGYTQSSVSGAFPASASSLTASTTIAYTWLRAA